MIHKYRTQFTARRENNSVSIEELQRSARDWLASKEDLPEEALEKEGDRELGSGASISVRHEIVGTEEQWAVRYRRPDDHEELTWVVDVAAAAADTTTLVSIGMGIELEAQRAVPVSRRIRPPAVVGRFARDFDLRAGCKISPQAQRIEPEAMAEFLEWVRSPSRSLPIVAVSVDAFSERPLLDPQGLQRLVLGIAEVVILPKLSAQRLTRLLDEIMGGREGAQRWTVHSGAARLYWPGLDLMHSDADPYRHKLWLPEAGRFRGPVDEEALAFLCWASAHRRYERWTDFRTIERKRDMERLAAGQTSSDAQRADHAIAIDRLQKDLDEARAQIGVASAEVEAARANAEQAWQQCRELQAEIAKLRSDLATVTPADDDTPRSVEDAIAKAKLEWNTTILFASDLRVDSSEGGGYWYGVLRALHELCKLDQAGELTDGHLSVDVRLPELLQRYANVRKRPKHADTGVEKLSPLSGARVHLRWRVHLRSGAPGESESVYWEPVESGGSKQLLVGVMGRHAE